MDDLLDSLFEVIIEVIFEGLTSTTECNRVPLILRILSALLLLVIFGGMRALMIVAGIALLKESSVFLGIFMFVIAAAVWIFAVYKFVKVYRNRQS